MENLDPFFNKYFYISKKEILLLILFWILIYFEPLNIGGYKLSQLWKGFLLGFLLLKLLRNKMPTWVIIGALFSLKFLVYLYFPYGINTALQEMLEELLIILLLLFYFKKYYYKQNYAYNLVRLSLIFSIFFLYSSIPFILGLESLTPIADLSRWGLKENNTKGLFHSMAVSSQVYCTSTLVIISSYSMFKKNLFQIIFFLFTVSLGAYLVYAGFTRTAWFIFIFGLFIIFIYGKKTQHLFFGLFIFTIMLSGIFWIYQNNEAVQLRLKGGAVGYRENVDLSFENLVNARLPLISVAIDNLYQEGVAAMMLGYGQQHSKDLFNKKTGMSIISHNRVMEIIESSGFIGLFLYIWFLVILYNKIWKNNILNYELKKLTLISSYLFIILFLSHGMPFWSQIIVLPVFAASMIYKEKRYIK